MSATLQELLDNIHILTSATRSTSDIAREIGAPEGAIVNPILCSVGEKPALVLMAGDKACDASQVSRIMNVQDPVTMMTVDQVVALTGGNADDLFPLELADSIPTILDASLKRFDTLYSRAGNPKCLIATTFDEMKTLTKGVISYAVASPAWHPKSL